MNSLLNLLEKKYKPEKITSILQAVRLDPVIVQSLENEDFLSRYLEVAQENEKTWTASSLAEFAAMYFEDDQQNGNQGSPIQLLAQAGKKAIQLRNITSEPASERNGIKAYMLNQTDDAHDVLMDGLVYGYGLQVNSTVYLDAMAAVLPLDQAVPLSTRAILQNELSETAIQQRFIDFLANKEIKDTGKWIRHLESLSYGVTAQKVAQSWLETNQQRIGAQSKKFSSEDFTALAELYQVTNLTSDTESALLSADNRLKEEAEKIKYLQFFQIKGQFSSAEQKSISWQEFSPATQVAFALQAENLDVETVEEMLPAVRENPLSAIRLAGLILDHKPAEARQIALNAMRILKQKQMDFQAFLPAGLSQWNPAELVNILNQVQLPLDAAKLGTAILETRSNDAELMQRLVETNLITQKWNDAEAHAKILHYRNPEDMTKLSVLATVYEKSGNWNRANESWQKVLNVTKGMDSNSIEHFMMTAIEAGTPEKALACCDGMTSDTLNYAGISFYRGKAHLKMGDKKKAEKAFLDGTHQDPTKGNNWLALAQYYQALGQTEKSVETLKTAAVHAPENVELLISLANLYLAKKDEATARKIMKQAAAFADIEVQTAVDLITNLSTLNEHQLIYDYVTTHQNRWHDGGKIAHLMAISCQALGKKADALQAYEQAMQGQELDPQWMLDYASALVDDGKEIFEPSNTIPVANYAKALQLLESASERGNAFPIRASLLEGELYLELGQVEKAFSHYQQMRDVLDGLETEMAIRFQTGLGTAAHAVGENEIAVAALKEASRDTNHAVYIYQRMAESYKDLNFQEEAMQAAKAALSAAPTIIANLAWFAEFAISMNATADAKEALEVATELAPDDIEYWIAYAVILAKLEDWELFETVLQQIRNFSNLNEQQFIKVADLFIDLNEIHNAEAFLLDGYQRLESEGVSQTYLLTLSMLSYHLGNYADATILIQHLLENRDWDAGLHTLFGDVLAFQEKDKAAAASYDHACKLLEMDEPQETLFATLSASMKPIATQAWIDSLYQNSAISLRLSTLELKEQKFVEAGNRFTAILDQKDPLNELSLYQLTLGAYLIQNEQILARVEELLSEMVESGQLADTKVAGAAAEIALDRHDSILAGKFIHPVLEKGESDWWATTIQVRLLLQNGEWHRAQELFANLFSNRLSSGNTAKISQESGLNQPVEEYVLQQLSLLKAAVELRKWSEAALLCKELESVKAIFPVINLTLIDMNLETVEFQRMADELKISTHAPGVEVIQEDEYSKSMANLTSIKSWIPASLHSRLSNRIQLVYRPSLQSIRDIVQSIPDSEDLRFLIPAVRRLDNCQGVQQLADKAGDDVEALMNTSLCALKEHREEAVSAIQAALRIKPNDPVSLFILSNCYASVGKPTEAYQSLEQAIAIWPDEALWHLRAAELSTNASKDNGKAHYAKAYELDSNEPMITHRYVSNLLQDRQVQDAYEIIEKAIKTHPKDWTLNGLMAQVLEQAGELDHAIEEMEVAVEKSDGDPSAKVQLAKLYLKKKSYADVYNLVADIKETQELMEDVLYLRSMALHQLGKPEKAMKLLDGYLANHTVLDDALLLERAKIIRDMQGERTAIVYVEEILTQYPESVEGYAMISDMHYQCGDLKDAAKYLDKGLKLDGSQEQMNYLNGLLALENGNLDLAVHSFAVTIQQNPSRVDAFKALADTHLRRREFEDAVKIILQGIEANPEELGLMMDAAKIFKDSKDYAEAESMLRKAATLRPDDLNIQRQLGAIIALNLVHKQ